MKPCHPGGRGFPGWPRPIRGDTRTQWNASIRQRHLHHLPLVREVFISPGQFQKLGEPLPSSTEAVLAADDGLTPSIKKRTGLKNRRSHTDEPKTRTALPVLCALTSWEQKVTHCHLSIHIIYDEHGFWTKKPHIDYKRKVLFYFFSWKFTTNQK